VPAWGGGTGASFASTLSSTVRSSEQVAAARDVLATLPAPIVYTLRDETGSPAEAVDRLFEALKNGSFQPPEGELGGPTTIIGATARAARLFESPNEMWGAMRSALGQPSTLAQAIKAAAGSTAPQASNGAVAGPPPDAGAAVTSHDQALALLGGPVPASQVEWWEAALRFLLGRDAEA
jgi:hypothetical protein